MLPVNTPDLPLAKGSLGIFRQRSFSGGGCHWKYSLGCTGLEVWTTTTILIRHTALNQSGNAASSIVSSIARVGTIYGETGNGRESAGVTGIPYMVSPIPYMPFP